MNIISLEDTLLHKTYLEVSMNNQDYLIQQPLIAHVQDNFKNITKLHLIINNKPTETSNSLTIDGVGEIHGSYQKIGDLLCIYKLINYGKALNYGQHPLLVFNNNSHGSTTFRIGVVGDLFFTLIE